MTVTFTSHAPGGSQGGDGWGYMHFQRPPLSTRLLCSDIYRAASKYSATKITIGTVDNIFKKAHINFTYASAAEYEDIKRNGASLLVMPCNSTADGIESIVNTAKLFYDLGGNVTASQLDNLQFLVDRGLFPSMPAAFGKTIALDVGDPGTSVIRSGDNMQVLKLDGLDPLIAWGTGGRTGHTTVAVWDRRGSGAPALYVCESTSASPFGSYWPPPYGVIRTPYQQWLKTAENATFSVVVLPLSADASAAFSEKNFWAWFDSVQGMPYGYHVMLFSFLDTADPAENLPYPINDGGEAYVLTELDRMIGHDNETEGSNMYSLIIEGLNHRMPVNFLQNTISDRTHCIAQLRPGSSFLLSVLRFLDRNTTCKGASAMACVMAAIVARNTTVARVASMPENDHWRYDADPATGFKGNYSMMCSAFVAHSYKVGLAGWSGWPQKYTATEQTPKDVYQSAIFDGTAGASAHFTETSCPGGGLIVDASGRGNYCQITGPFRLMMNGYNSVKMYDNMNEHCAAQWPTYKTTRPC